MNEEFAKEHLNLVLSFFPRVESQISLLVGLEVIMAGYLTSRLPSVEKWHDVNSTAIVLLTIAAAGLLTSFVILYLASFPKLDGGEGSLIYFRAIAGRSESDFTEEYRRLQPEQLTIHLVGQIWRNAEILTMKYDRLKWAFICFALAAVAWIGTLLTLP